MNQERHAAMFRILASLPESSRGRMARMYADSLNQLLPQLAEAVGAGQAQDTRTLAHKVAGAAAMMQDEQLASLMRRMESLLLESEIAQAFALWPHARAAAGDSLAVLQAAFPPPQ